MRNLNFLLTLLAYILISLQASSQIKSNRYYYAYDEKIPLHEVSNKLIIGFPKNNAANIKALIHTATIDFENDSICILTVDSSQSERLKQTLLQTEGIKSVQPIYKTDDGMEMGITDEIVVRFNDNALPDDIRKTHEKYQVTIKKTTDLYQLITVPLGIDALDIANRYQLSGLVKYSHPNFLSKVEKHQTIQNDPYFVNQFYLHNTGQTFNGHSGTAGADINAPEAWDITKGSSDIIVAVIDEGVTSNHPDLPNTRQVRLNGSNFASGDVNDPSPVGDDNHGNSCAGVIAASHNSEGVAGIAPKCKIMPIRIPFGTVPASVYADALTFAKANGAHILSNSWGYGTPNPNAYPVIKNAIEDATLTGRNGKGCVVVFSAGNTACHVYGDNGFVAFPSNVNVSGVLTVGASDRYDTQADYSPTSVLSSSNNQIVDIIAPSHRAYSCYISTETFECWTIDIPGTAGYNTWKNTESCYLPLNGTTFPNSGTNYQAYTGYFGGTSCACPEVAAVAALILSLNSNLTQQQVTDIIESTARKAGNYTYQTVSGISNGTWNSQMGHGVLDTYAAAQAACVTSFTNQTVTTNTTVGGCASLTVQNVTVTNNAKLTLNAPNGVTINSPFEVVLGSLLEVQY
ncbi:MAG: S8 family serine peptidase [Tannerellaceae bacterium]|jgi:subtilisin family serine protease|nr:S8 family serine peptidase [Tannerellaceae bacterium]